MKQIIILVIAGLSIYDHVLGQTLKQKETITTNVVIPERTVKLNSTLRLGGTSRMSIPITLPANTVEWYYSITTYADGTTTNDKINLAVQLATAVAAATTGAGQVAAFTGLDQAVVNALKIPSGSMPINTYVFDKNNSNLFLDKKPTSSMGAAERITQGVVKMNGLLTNTGTWYLALGNLDATGAIQVKIEVVAIVKETKWVAE